MKKARKIPAYGRRGSTSSRLAWTNAWKHGNMNYIILFTV